MRTIPILAVMAAAIAAGCDMEDWNPALSPAPSSDAAPIPKPVMATVNGEVIYMEQLNEILVANYGMTIAQHLVADMLVEQEAKRRGITVTEDDIRAEGDYKLDQVTVQPDAGPAERRELLRRMLAKEGLSYADYQRVLRREALLRKMAMADVRIYEADLRNEFDRQYGRQVLVRHIQVESIATAEQILQMVRDGADFARLAQEYSLDPSGKQGGLRPPIGAMTTECPPVIRDVAMSLRRPGELSEIIRTGTAYHLLQLEQDIPPQDASFEEVKDQLRASVLRRTIDEQAKPRLLQRLFSQANLQYADPILRRQYAQHDMQP